MPADGNDGLEVVPDLLPPVHEDAGTLELIEHSERNKLLLDGSEQLVANGRHFLTVAKLSEILASHAPPCLQHIAMSGEGLLQRSFGLHGGLDGGLGCEGWEKSKIARTLALEQSVGS